MIRSRLARSSVVAGIALLVVLGSGCNKDSKESGAEQKQATAEAEKPTGELEKPGELGEPGKNEPAKIAGEGEPAVPAGKPASQVLRVAQVFPEKIMFFAWLDRVSFGIELLDSWGLSSEQASNIRDFREMCTVLGFNPLDKAWLESSGLDLDGPIGLIVNPGPRDLAMFALYIPIKKGVDGLVAFQTVVDKFKYRSELEITDVEGHEGSARWLNPAGHPKGAPAGVAIKVDGGLILAVDVDRIWDDNRPSLLQPLIDSALGEGKGVLGNLPEFKQLTEGAEGVLGGGLVLTSMGRQMINLDKDLILGLNLFSFIQGVAGFLSLDEAALKVQARVLYSDSSRLLLAPRDKNVVGLIGDGTIPFAGFGSIDAVKFIQELERLLILERWTWREYQKGLTELRELTGLPGGTGLADVFTGEFGIWVKDFTGELSFLQQLTGFVGVKDSAVVAAALDALMPRIGRYLTKDTSGEKPVYWFQDGYAGVGIALVGNRVWISGSKPELMRIAEGKAVEVAPRTKALSEAFGGDEAVVAFADLKSLVAKLPLVLSRRERRDLEPFWGLITRLDAIKVSLSNGDNSLDIKASVTVDSGTFLGLVSTFGKAVLEVELNRYTKQVKTTEAVDALDKIFKGAVVYYTAPKVSEAGELLPCQFPATQPATPTGGSCCGKLGGPDRDGDGRCDESPEVWDTPTWSALNFMMADPHYCTYTFESNGRTGADAAFTATANCDLDCDGILSTFQRFAQGSEGEDGCSVGSFPSMYVDNELE